MITFGCLEWCHLDLRWWSCPYRPWFKSVVLEAWYLRVYFSIYIYIYLAIFYSKKQSKITWICNWKTHRIYPNFFMEINNEFFWKNHWYWPLILNFSFFIFIIIWLGIFIGRGNSLVLGVCNSLRLKKYKYKYKLN